MANLERGAIESRDDSFDFDDEEPAAEEGTRLPVLVVIALLVLAAFAGVVWLAYTQGVERGRTEGSQTIVQRAAPKNAGETTPFTGLNIYQPVSPQARHPATVKGPVHPASALPALRPTSSGGTETFAAGTQPEHPFAEPAASAVPSPSRPPGKPVAAKTPPAPSPPAAKPVAAKTPPAPSPPVDKPVAAKAAPTVAATATKPVEEKAAPKAGDILLQIGSYKSEAEAQQSWLAFKAHHPAAAAYGIDIREADLAGRGVWYRLRIGPFDTKDAAAETCAKLRADGANCLIAR